MLLILTQADDPHATAACRTLAERGCPYVRFDPAEFPAALTASVHVASGASRIVLHGGPLAAPLDLDEVSTVWWRRPTAPVAHPELHGHDYRTAVEDECANFLDDLWQATRCRWVPTRPHVLRGTQKLYQLRVAEQMGFTLPDTLVTTDPQAFLDFYERHGGNVISKRAAPSRLTSPGTPFCRYTEVVTRRDLGYVDAIRYSPMIYQAYVPKSVELRITVVGNQVFAAEIHSQESNHTRHDWRRYDHYRTTYAVHPLPAPVARRCLALVERLGLVFGTIDMVVTPAGEYVFLEINANGQYLWIEEYTGLPINSAMADLLTGADVGDVHEYV